MFLNLLFSNGYSGWAAAQQSTDCCYSNTDSTEVLLEQQSAGMTGLDFRDANIWRSLCFLP
jgi:hypothetical protein